MSEHLEEFDTLVIAANFFGYVREITSLMERRGRRPAWFEDRPGIDTTTKLLVRAAPRLMRGRSDAYFGRIIEKMRRQPIRDVLIIKGEALSPATLAALRRAFPLAKFTLYLWDSYRNMPADTRSKTGLFDRAFTFDPVDAEQDRRLEFRPLFYLPEFGTLASAEADIDVLFIGTSHTDRYEVTQLLARSLPRDVRFKRILYYPSRGLFQVKRLARPSYWRADPENFIFKPVSRPDVLRMIARSRIILDIERAVQVGYTMRTIETLGAGKKLATTNAAVAKADFYRPNNHFILDRSAPRLAAEFLDSPFEALPEPVMKRYSLQGWLEGIGF